MNSKPAKSGREEDDEESDSRSSKAKRVEFDVPIADVDLKLAEKLDNVLKISFNAKPKFLTNRTKSREKDACNTTDLGVIRARSNPEKLIRRNLTKEELHERVLRKYDTMVTEKDRKLPEVNVKFLSTSESIELGRDQARKQMERQLELNSISGNQAAMKNGAHGFKFNDGYEMPAERFSNHANQITHLGEPGESILRHAQGPSNCSKSVTFSTEHEEYEDCRVATDDEDQDDD